MRRGLALRCLILPILCASLAACAVLRARDLARERAEARIDDAACSGTDFPSDAYTTCRRQLAEQRQRRQWMELALVQQQTRNNTPEQLPVAPPGVYIPIDPARYACGERHTDGERWIACAER